MWNWVQRVADLIPSQKAEPPSDVDGRETSSTAASANKDTTRPSRWFLGAFEAGLAGLPLVMLLVGGALAACTELIGPWAVLGYLLIVVAPLVLYLRRIDKQLGRLNEQLANNRR